MSNVATYFGENYFMPDFLSGLNGILGQFKATQGGNIAVAIRLLVCCIILLFIWRSCGNI